MTQPNLQITPIAGTELASWEWNPRAKGQAPTLLFAHATGFHGRAYDAIIEHFPDRHVLSLDVHGHGCSGGDLVEHWVDIIAETRAWLEHLGVKSAHGIGHSMGGHILVQLAADTPDMFSKLTLFDPVIVDPEWYVSGELSFSPDAPHPAIKRKRDFASAGAMFERFKDRDPYALFEPRVLRDYCEYGLLEKADGDGMELACSPEMEASFYGSSRSNGGIIEASARVDIPVTVVRALRTTFSDFKSSPTWPGLADHLPQGTDVYRPDMTHFHPFQDPADAARIIAES
ncbi:MAG: alpha/beta hydrolase [Marinomonas sp.]